MKREILFKAITVKSEFLFKSNKWVQGDLLHKIVGKDEKQYHSNIKDGVSIYHVLPETVCEFANKKDIKGVKVFEGDYDNDGNCVAWCDSCNGWEFAAIDIPTKEVVIGCHRCDGNFFFEDHIGEFEIVGNIHDK